MEQNTKITAEDGKQELMITREFDLPVDLLFRAYVEPEIVEQWMGTKVLKLEGKIHGGYRFETTDPRGNRYNFTGVIHDCVQNKQIVRTFEFEHMPFGVQLEFMEFEPLTENTSKLNVHTIFRSAQERDRMLEAGFVHGLNLAHNRLQNIANKFK